MGYTSKFKGAEIDAILESCVFPSFFFDAVAQDAVTKDVIDNLWQYMRGRGVPTIHDVRLGMNLEMEASNTVLVTSDLRIVNDDKLYTKGFMYFYDYDGIVHRENFVAKYPLTFEG
jgi:hypothetical protein